MQLACAELIRAFENIDEGDAFYAIVLGRRKCRGKEKYIQRRTVNDCIVLVLMV